MAAATLIAAPPAVGQTTGVSVLDITTPVLDIETETSSLDSSVKRAESGKAVQVTLSADVLFAFNKASLTDKARKRIRAAAADIRANGGSTAKVVGHTDSKGSDSFNDDLSLRRARSVEKALSRLLGSDAPRFQVKGRGEDDPVAANTTPDGDDNPKGRAQNRRVEIRLPKSG